MSEVQTSSETAAPVSAAVSSHPATRRRYGRRLLAIVPPSDPTASLTDLAGMISRGHAVRERGDLGGDRNQRLLRVIVELESLVDDLRQDAGRAPSGTRSDPSPGSSSAVSDTPGQDEVESAFEAWLTNPEVALQVSVTGLLGELVTSGRVLSPAAVRELGMLPGTTMGHAATELLLAVNDTTGPRCRSYRSALFYLRDHDDASLDQ